jgi:hypothetical protein
MLIIRIDFLLLEHYGIQYMASLEQAFVPIEDYCIHCGTRRSEHSYVAECTFESSLAKQVDSKKIEVRVRETQEDYCKLCPYRRREHPPYFGYRADHEFVYSPAKEAVTVPSAKLCIWCGNPESVHKDMLHEFKAY